MRTKLLFAAIGGLLGGVSGANLPNKPTPRAVEYADTATVMLDGEAMVNLTATAEAAIPGADLDVITCRAVDGTRGGEPAAVAMCGAEEQTFILSVSSQAEVASIVDAATGGMSWTRLHCKLTDKAGGGQVYMCDVSGVRVVDYDDIPEGKAVYKYGTGRGR